jgi:hypothetical protein
MKHTELVANDWWTSLNMPIPNKHVKPKRVTWYQ